MPNVRFLFLSDRVHCLCSDFHNQMMLYYRSFYRPCFPPVCCGLGERTKTLSGQREKAGFYDLWVSDIGVREEYQLPFALESKTPKCFVKLHNFFQREKSQLLLLVIYWRIVVLVYVYGNQQANTNLGKLKSRPNQTSLKVLCVNSQQTGNAFCVCASELAMGKFALRATRKRGN